MRPRSSSRRARSTLIWFVVAVLVLHAAALFLLDEAEPGRRDTEYAIRVTALRDRVAENPGRPRVVVVGSSRVVAAVNPAAWEAVRPNDPGRPDPLLFNLGQVGAGPVLELMTVRRLLADGPRPDLVMIEYWPPFLHSEGEWEETRRIPPDRLYPIDRQAVRDYFPEPDAVLRKMDWYRWNPINGSRHRIMAQLLPRWLPEDRRIDRAWSGVDGWGWKPGAEERRAAIVAQCAETYRPLFADYRISPKADGALRETVAVARESGAAVGFVFLPESSEFRLLYPSAIERQVREHLAGLSRGLGVPVIDCRDWLEDRFVADGFHLTRTGAGEFTRKFGAVVATTFPDAGGGRSR